MENLTLTAEWAAVYHYDHADMRAGTPCCHECDVPSEAIYHLFVSQPRDRHGFPIGVATEIMDANGDPIRAWFCNDCDPTRKLSPADDFAKVVYDAARHRREARRHKRATMITALMEQGTAEAHARLDRVRASMNYTAAGNLGLWLRHAHHDDHAARVEKAYRAGLTAPEAL